MVWTAEDGADAESAIRKMRDAIECLTVDARVQRPRNVTRAALDAAMAALLALDDVYFENEAGEPVPEAWRRARELLRPGRR